MKLAILLFALFAMTSTPALSPKPKKLKMVLTFLMLEGCPNSPLMKANLDVALRKLKLPKSYETFDIGKLSKGDPRCGYAAPTVLLNGKDLFGAPSAGPAAAPMCRLYSGGVPTADRIADKLRKHLAGGH